MEGVVLGSLGGNSESTLVFVAELDKMLITVRALFAGCVAASSGRTANQRVSNYCTVVEL